MPWTDICLLLCSAATEFIKTFYPALGSNRESLSSYYSLEPTTILFNGNRVADGAAVQEIFTNQMSPTYYEVQSYDCQIINKAYPTILPGGGLKPQSEMGVKDMSFLIVVSGFVRYGEGRDQPQRGFSETFVLVPNPSAERARGRKDWLIESQNFRLVVWTIIPTNHESASSQETMHVIQKWKTTESYPPTKDELLRDTRCNQRSTAWDLLQN